MRSSLQRSILFCLLVLLLYASFSIYFIALANGHNVGPWLIDIPYFALGGGLMAGGALAGAFVALQFCRPKRPPSIVATIILAALYFFLASLLGALIRERAGPYWTGLAQAFLAFLWIRYPGRLTLEPLYRWLEEHQRLVKPLAFIGVLLALAISDFSVRALAEKRAEPVAALMVWGLLVALCVGVGSMSIEILVPASRTRRFVSRLSYVGGMLAVAVWVMNPGFFLPGRHSEDRSGFFPEANQNDGVDDFKEGWYGWYLAGLREEPLCCSRSDLAEIYRFTWLRTFDHPVIIRLERDLKGRWYLHTKVSSGAGGYEVGLIGLDLVRSVSVASARHLRDSMSVDSAFWKTPSQSPSMGLDGAQWILESKVGNAYHFADHYSPREGLVHDIGLQFLEASGGNFGEIY